VREGRYIVARNTKRAAVSQFIAIITENMQSKNKNIKIINGGIIK